MNRPSKFGYVNRGCEKVELCPFQKCAFFLFKSCRCSVIIIVRHKRTSELSSDVFLIRSPSAIADICRDMLDTLTLNSLRFQVNI